MFRLTQDRLNVEKLRRQLMHPECGAYVSFEGWVRNRNQGREVLRLEYEAYAALALKEGEKILRETQLLFRATLLHCVHRLGVLEIGETAVWIGAVSPHRRDALAACDRVIEEVKHRVPIWKKEHYRDGKAEWILCAHEVVAPQAAIPANSEF